MTTTTNVSPAVLLWVLEKARERVARNWTQERFAVDSNGRVCPPTSEEAVAWCAAGALEAVLYDPGSEAWFAPFDAASDLLTELLGVNFVRWNDAPGRTQAEVLDLFDRAIARVQEGQR